MAGSDDENDTTSSKQTTSTTRSSVQENATEAEAKGYCSSDSQDEYTDYSLVPDPQSPQHVLRNAESTVPIRYRKFPAKLDAMLSSPELERFISWMPHGRSWKIHDSEGFAAYVLPIFFENQSFNSFIRLVNAWGFRRKMNNGIDRNSYYHKCFLRGKPHLRGRMSRLGTSKKKPIANEPDLFAFPQLPPTTTIAPNLPLAVSRSGISSQSRSMQPSAAAIAGRSASVSLGTAGMVRQQPTTSIHSSGQAVFGTSHETSEANVQQIIRLLQQGSAQNLQPLREEQVQQHLPRSIPAGQVWVQQAVSSSNSVGAHTAAGLRLRDFLNSRDQQPQVERRLDQHHEQEQKQDGYSSRSNDGRDHVLGTALTTGAFVEQAARELALRQIRQHPSSNPLLLTSMIDHQASSQNQHLSAIPSLRQIREHQQLPSIPSRSLLIDFNAAIASDSSSMVPNYLRNLIEQGATLSARVDEPLSRPVAAARPSDIQVNARHSGPQPGNKTCHEDDVAEERKKPATGSR